MANHSYILFTEFLICTRHFINDQSPLILPVFSNVHRQQLTYSGFGAAIWVQSLSSFGCVISFMNPSSSCIYLLGAGLE